ncbi:hypothetical protein JTE90_023155 [Oedothorax gibbosus]|uniref:Uncharacterized protein n=1 Tax=Oedothorax gibbosus TaxID=931172 RepID=A0AAV6UQL2_9ARAC|nr:hypothetical protein JTE90_023155 [Oedothorax gibbosus]
MQHPYVNPYYGAHPAGSMLWADNVKKLYDMIWLENCYASQYAQQEGGARQRPLATPIDCAEYLGIFPSFHSHFPYLPRKSSLSIFPRKEGKTLVFLL